MVAQIRDLTLEARRATCQRRRGCRHDWQARRRGVEQCSQCGDQFPCRADCRHLDCLERKLELGIRSGFPRDFPISINEVAPGHSATGSCGACFDAPEDHYRIAIWAGGDPDRWVLPWRLEAP